MIQRLLEPIRRSNLAAQYMIASLLVLAMTMVGVGWWVGEEIETGVVSRTGAVTALYVDSFISPYLQSLGRQSDLSPQDRAALNELVSDTGFRNRIVSFKIWGENGRLLFATNSTDVGRVFPIHNNLARAFQGEVVSGISNLEGEENVTERARYRSLMETYSPVFQSRANRVVAVVEFYETTSELQTEMAEARNRSWLVVGFATLVSYLLLSGIVRGGSNTIARQQAALSRQVVQLTELVKQNAELHKRVQRAAARTSALTERSLRRFSSELHDGPAQALTFALLRLDSVPICPQHAPTASHECPDVENLTRVKNSLRGALEEIRTMATGLRLPELASQSLPETIGQVVRRHEEATATGVSLSTGPLPEQVPLLVKITAYRVIQESLSNAFRHGGGAGQAVRVVTKGDQLVVQISDRGPGFNWQPAPGAGDGHQHLGLVGMRERVESLGGLFSVTSAPGQGTKVVARLPLNPPEIEEENYVG